MLGNGTFWLIFLQGNGNITMFRGTFALKKGWILDKSTCTWSMFGTITPRHQTDMIRQSAVVGWTNKPHQAKVK